MHLDSYINFLCYFFTIFALVVNNVNKSDPGQIDVIITVHL